MDHSTRHPEPTAEILVAGGGLAGLSAAVLAAKSGCSVLLLEQSREVGGRALTNVDDGVHFNLGPRALFRGGHAFRLLRQLGVPLRGAPPNPGKAVMTQGDRRHAMPTGMASLISTGLLGFADKLRLARFLQAMRRINPRTVDSLTVDQWAEQMVGRGRAALVLHALLRLATYANDPRNQSAGAALEQLQLALAANVQYLDGGWQTLVDSLRDLAEQNGVTIRTGSRVESIRCVDGRAEVRLGDGKLISAQAAIVAADPQTAVKILDLPPDHAVSTWARGARPARAACLDLALTRLPRPGERLALGLDQPMYLSVHSAAARLAPQGIAVVHVMKYLPPEPPLTAGENERELERFLDTVQPGWREYVHRRRFLPNMVVSHGIPLAAQLGTKGRPDVPVADRPAVFLAGDWVGPDGQLADAAVASAQRAAQSAARTTVRAGRGASDVAGPVHERR